MKTPTCTSTPNIGIDWVTVTFRHDRVNHDLMLNCLVFLTARYYRTCSFDFKGHRNGFENRFVVERGGEVACYSWGGNQGFAMLEFRGSYCGHVDWAFWRMLRWFVHRYNCRLTRVDIAADFYQGEIDIVALEESYRLDPSSVLKLSGSAPKLGVVDRGCGRTLYFGTRQSPREICIYEKGRQLAGDKEPDFPGWVRVELRFRKHKLSEIPRDTLKPTVWWKFIWGLGPVFARNIPDELCRRRQYQRRTVQAAMNARVRKQIQHVRANYGKFLWFLSLLGEPAEVLSMLVNPVGEWSGLKDYPGWSADGDMAELLSDVFEDAAWAGFQANVFHERSRLDRGDL